MEPEDMACIPSELVFSEVRHAVVRVYALLAAHAARLEPGVPVTVGRKVLAAQAGTGERTLTHALNDLADDGWIEILPRKNEQGRTITNGYLL